MADTTLSVRYAGPLVTLQDGGRTGHMRFGVPMSGPMDRLAMAAANTALGNAADATCIEVSLGGATFGCMGGPVTLAIAGGAFVIDHDGLARTSWTVLTLQHGQTLTLRPGAWGSWAYIAVAGSISCNTWLGASATHSQSGLGGGAVTSGMTLTIQNSEHRDTREGDIPQPDFHEPTGTADVVLGPQKQHFEAGASDQLTTQPYTLTDAYDRMGVRLDGPPLPLNAALSIPSEPIARGSLQVSGDGLPTLLLADHQSTGGYPKIATVLSCDLHAISQMRSRDVLRFRAVTPQQAVGRARDYSAKVQTYLAGIATPRGTLAQRLMSENLISGVIFDPADDR